MTRNGALGSLTTHEENPSIPDGWVAMSGFLGAKIREVGAVGGRGEECRRPGCGLCFLQHPSNHPVMYVTKAPRSIPPPVPAVWLTYPRLSTVAFPRRGSGRSHPLLVTPYDRSRQARYTTTSLSTPPLPGPPVLFESQCPNVAWLVRSIYLA